MRTARACLVFVGLLLGACGGSDFVAATPGDAGSTTPDARSDDDTTSPAMDGGASDASHGDDGVPDANGERVVEDATTADGSGADATTEATRDAPLQDAMPEAAAETGADAPATCDAPTAFYRDRDRDGFGSTDNSVLACTAPAADDAGAWVSQPGDCRDDLFEVKPFKANSPDPPKYSGTGYADPVRPRGISFDYDCNGDETGDSTN